MYTVCENKYKNHLKNIECPLFPHLLLFAAIWRGVVAREKFHLPFRYIGKSPGNCETGQSVRADSNSYGFCRALDTYYRIPATIFFKMIICWPFNERKKAVNKHLATAKKVDVE